MNKKIIPRPKGFWKRVIGAGKRNSTRRATRVQILERPKVRLLVE